jgi:glycosyltransferase involved in cell wall biosynthesis
MQVTKRVFILSPDSPERLGGVEHFIRELGRGLRLRGYEVEFFHRQNSTPKWLQARSGRLAMRLSGSLTGYFVGKNAIKSFDDNVVAFISNSTVGYWPVRRLSKSLKRFHFYHGTYRGQSEAIRAFITYRGYLFVKWWESMIVERLSGRAKTVFSCSDPIREEVLRYFGFDSTTMWYPIDLDRFCVRDRETCRQRLGLTSTDLVGVFVGNTSPMKNFEVVRAMVNALPEVHWLLALRGDTVQHFQGNPRVRIFHDATPDQVPDLYNAADFSLCPSRYDPFPYVVSESLACGTPVIAAPHGASRFFLGQPPLDRLLVSDPDATEEFIAAAREVLRDPTYYRQMVIEHARPRLVEAMGPENWWRRFFEQTGL